MNKLKPIVTYEFGTLYIEGQAHKEGDTPLRESTFNNLWDFILSNKANDDTDVVMSVHTRGGRRYIKTGRYVGTIQTRDGQVIEILPKIYKSSGQQEDDQNVCRSVFLNMLRHFTDAKARSFQNATLGTKKGFPILEVYISNYLDAVERLLIGGLKKDYNTVAENQRFLKGRLNVGQQITKNATNKARFAISYNKYIEDIPQNRVIVTTLRRLLDISHSVTNKSRITKALTVLSEIPSCSNIERDIQLSNTANRLFAAYDLIIKWSSQFLLNRGFTTFSGNCVNQSLLFQAERLFEDFVAYLFKKYAPTYKVEAQNNRYFLVDRHDGSGMFRLRPDILVESDIDVQDYECIIVDTKWKSIDATRPDHHYLIDMKDMYQLYAYGHKYGAGQSRELGMDVTPKLVLVYPYSEKFTEQLPEFVYEDIKNKYGLRLMVVPFNLTAPKTYEQQVHSIIHCLDVTKEVQPIYNFKYEENNPLPLVAAEGLPQYGATARQMLVGCFTSPEQLEWIKSKHLYNVRLTKKRSGHLVGASRLLLYNSKKPSEYYVYDLDPLQQIMANQDVMTSYQYPKHTGREYLLYVMGDEVKRHPDYDVIKIKEKNNRPVGSFTPFFVTY